MRAPASAMLSAAQSPELSVDLLQDALDIARTLAPLLATVVIVVVVIGLVNRVLSRRWRDEPDAQFRFQLIMLLLTFVGGLAIVVALPVTDTLRGQLLSLIGILLSAAIALSSTTFIGNVMAGIMLKTIRNARPGDFVTIGDVTGRITEMDLLHTEVQTEFRDLVTIPNLVMVTQPMKVVRASGTIITAEVSLGYDVPNAQVRELLKAAADAAGLKDCFAHVRELGDFSINYRVAGLLEDAQSLISARSALRVAVLDTLHEAGIEIVSPNFMNTRALEAGSPIIPAARPRAESDDESTRAESVVFDKAEEAASVEEIRKQLEAVDAEIASLEDGDASEREALDARRASIAARLAAAEERRKDSDE